MMGRVKIYLIITCLTFCGAMARAQQTIQSSQYMFNGLVINPAYAGYKEDWTLNLGSRLQWAGIDGSPRTNTLSIDGLVDPDKNNMGLGLLITNDRLGPENNSAAYLNYSYRLRLDDEDTKRLSFGIGAGLVQYRIDASKFNPLDPTDTNIPLGNENTLNADFRLGAYYTTPSFYAGASVLNVFSENISGNNTLAINPARHVYLTAGTLIMLSPVIDWKPSVMFKSDFKGPTDVDLTTYFLFAKKFWVGATYSTGVALYNRDDLQTNLTTSDAITAAVQFSLSDHLRFGYSYDFTTGGLARYQTGSHEISLSLSFRRKQPRIISPRFF